MISSCSQLSSKVLTSNLNYITSSSTRKQCSLSQIKNYLVTDREKCIGISFCTSLSKTSKTNIIQKYLVKFVEKEAQVEIYAYQIEIADFYWLGFFRFAEDEGAYILTNLWALVSKNKCMINFRERNEHSWKYFCSVHRLMIWQYLVPVFATPFLSRKMYSRTIGSKKNPFWFIWAQQKSSKSLGWVKIEYVYSEVQQKSIMIVWVELKFGWSQNQSEVIS